MTVCSLIVAFDLGFITAAVVVALVNRQARHQTRHEADAAHPAVVVADRAPVGKPCLAHMLTTTTTDRPNTVAVPDDLSGLDGRGDQIGQPRRLRPANRTFFLSPLRTSSPSGGRADQPERRVILEMTNPLQSLAEFTDGQLRSLGLAASHRAHDPLETSRAWLGLWHELSVLAAEELNRRASSLRALDRDADGLVDADEVGALVADPGTLVWSADTDPSAVRADLEIFRRGDGPEAA